MIAPFSAWREGMIHYLPALLIACACGYFAHRGVSAFWVGAVFFGFYGLFSLFFFRDPPRTVTAEANEVVSPADGTIVGIEDLDGSPYYDGPCTRVSIFLSVFSVHINRAPFEGTVETVKYQPGRFENAMKPESSAYNESNAVWMTTAWGPMTVRQISGALARRIVCPVAEGAVLGKGEKFGMIKLGSRTELYLPRSAEVCVKMKEKVYAGTSKVARFP
ncbi:MAG: phosphatidylserine decarboxylase family protein [Nitrospiraceae bacterium]|nr:phosphatidylserine decarboxylase family protein [Nitrospiraceae bacterium]